MIPTATASCSKRPPVREATGTASTDVFVAIASPVRRALLDALVDGAAPVRDLGAGWRGHLVRRLEETLAVLT